MHSRNIGNDTISSSKKHQEKADQDWRKNSNKRPRTRSSKINTRPQFFDKVNVSKITRPISLQRICEVNARVRDPPRCYKTYVFFRESQNCYSPQPGMTRIQLLVNNQRPIRLTTEQPYQIRVLNSDGNHLPTQQFEFVTTVVTWYMNCHTSFYFSAPRRNKVSLFL